MEEIMDLRGKISNGNVVVIDFFGENCPSCKKIDPVLRELSNEMEVDFFKFNVEKDFDIASEFGIMAIPNLVLFKDGNPVDQLIGYAEKDKIKEWVTANL